MVDAIRVTRLLRSLDQGLAPTDNGDAIRRIGDAGIIESTTASAMVSAVGFRNVLVHEYVELDDAIVIDRLRDHRDLEDFARQIGEWMSRQQDLSPRSGLN